MNGPILVYYLLLLAGAVCFILGFLRRWESTPPGVSIGWLGMFFWILSVMIFGGAIPK